MAKNVEIVGIDLGTTYSVVSYYDPTEQRVRTMSFGGRYLIPSSVFYRPEDASVLVGERASAAVQNAPTLSHRLIYDSKRIIGRSIKDEMTQHAIQHSGWGFEVEGDGDFTTFVLGKSPDPVLRVSPKRVATDIGSYIKKELEPFLKSATQCVVTVPAYFTAAQAKCTVEAMHAAGWGVVELLKEPVAAAIYEYSRFWRPPKHSKVLNEKRVMVLDFGGGTFDVCVAKITRRGGDDDGGDGGGESKGNEEAKVDLQSVLDITVEGVEGSTFCGGRDIDIEIAKYVAQEAKRKCGVDVVATRNLRGGTLEAALEATTNSVFNTYKGKPPSKDIEDFLSFKNGEPLKRAIKKDLMANVQNLLNSAEITKKQIGGGGESCEVSIAIPGEEESLVSVSLRSLTREEIRTTREAPEGTLDYMAKATISRCMESIKRMLETLNLSSDSFDEVLLVGGSSNLLCFQEAVRQLLLCDTPGGPEFRLINDNQSAVANGAAMYAAKLAVQRKTVDERTVKLPVTGEFIDVLGASIGVSIVGDRFHPFLERGAQIRGGKLCAEGTLATAWDNQTTAGFEIYEGNRKMAAYNHKLGEITLTGGMEGEAGERECKWKVEYDGTLKVKVWWADKGEGQGVSLNIGSGAFVPPAALKAIEFTPRSMQKKDEEEFMRAEASYYLHLLVSRVEQSIKGLSVPQAEEARTMIAAITSLGGYEKYQVKLEEVAEHGQKLANHVVSAGLMPLSRVPSAFAEGPH